MTTVKHTNPKNKKKKRNVGSSLKQTNVDAGTNKLQVRSIKLAKWSKPELKIDESIEASIEVIGIADGKRISFRFYQKSLNRAEKLVDKTSQTVSGSKATVQWKYTQAMMAQFANDPIITPTIYFNVEYICSAKESYKGQSGQIPIHADLKIKLEKENGYAVPNEPVEIVRSNGLVDKSKTDGTGFALFKKVPTCKQIIRFPNIHHVEPENVKLVNVSNQLKDKYAIPQGDKPTIFQVVSLYFYCLHTIEGNRRSVVNVDTFDVVPEFKGKDAYKDEIVVLSQLPRTLLAENAEVKKLENELGMHAYSITCKQEHGGVIPEVWSPDFWKGLLKPLEYKVSGLPRPLTIRCYRPDIFKFQFKFPAMRKWSGGTKVTSSTKDFVYEVKNKRPINPMEFEYKKEKTGWDLKKFPKPISQDLPIILQRNDQQLTLDFLETAGAVIDLANKLSFIITAIQENTPRVGWYFDWENQFFQGTVVFEWGWKEYKDHRAFYYIGVNLDIKLIDIKLEIGIGVSGFACKLQVYGALTGAVTLSAKIARISPDSAMEFSLPFAAEIIGALGARFEAGYFVKIEGSVETGLKLNDGVFKFTTDNGCSFACTLQWTGIKAKLKVSGGVGKKEGTENVKDKTAEAKKGSREFAEQGTSDYEHELIGPVDLKDWKFPNSKFQYNPPVIAKEELHKMIVKKIKDGSNIRVKTGENFVGLNKYMDMEKVAEAVEKVIHARNDLRLDPKTAESLVLEVRQDLEVIMNQHPEEMLLHLSEVRFKQFCNGGELEKILNNHIDPMQEIINHHKK